MSRDNAKPNPLRTLAVSAALVLATFAAYHRVLTYPFVDWDDNTHVYANRDVRTGLTWDNFKWSWGIHGPSQWHPLAWWSHQLDCQLYGADPQGTSAHGHHATNLLLHVAATLALLMALKRLTGAFWPSAAVAALFALHPMNVESVAWISERRDVLCGLFFALTLWAYAAYAQRGGGARYALVLLCFVLGLMSKPMLITLPCVLMLLDYWPLRRIADWPDQLLTRTPTSDLRLPTSPWWLVLEKLPLLLLGIGSAWLSYKCQAAEDAIGSLEQYSWEVRIFNAVQSYVMYLWNMVWPANLSPMYPLPREFNPAAVAGAAILLLAITALALWQWRRRPWLLVGWLWYLGMLVPVIGLLRMGVDVARADRWAYLPLIGIYIALAWSVRDLVAGSRSRQWAVAIVAGAALVACGLLTFRQVDFWRGSIPLLQRAIAMNPNATEAHNNLGIELHNQRHYREAIDEFNEVLQRKPRHARALNNLGVSLQSLHRLREAIPYFEAAIAADPNYPDAHSNLADALDDTGHSYEALPHYRQAIKGNKYFVNAHFNFGVVLMKLGRNAEAAQQFRETLAIDPTHAEARRGLNAITGGR